MPDRDRPPADAEHDQLTAENERLRADLAEAHHYRTRGGPPPACDPDWANLALPAPPSAADPDAPPHHRPTLRRTT